MTTPSRTRAGRIGLLVVTFLLILVAVVVDLAREESVLRSVVAIEGPGTPAENLVRGVRRGLARPSR